MECGCLHGGVIKNGHTRNPLTLCSVHVLVHVQVWVHIAGDPQECSAEELYNNCYTSNCLKKHQTQYPLQIMRSVFPRMPVVMSIFECTSGDV